MSSTPTYVAALRSKHGASFKLLHLLGTGRYQPVISPPMYLEYEDLCRRPGLIPDLTGQDIGDFLDYFLSECIECPIYFLWRPFLPDPKDDLVLELALAGTADAIITHNVRDFNGAGSLGIRVMTPAEFLDIIGGL